MLKMIDHIIIRTALEAFIEKEQDYENFEEKNPRQDSVSLSDGLPSND